MPANLENSAMTTGLEKVRFHSNTKERQCQRMFKLLYNCTHLSSVQFSCSVMSDSLWSHGPHHARPPCPLPTPGVSHTLAKSCWKFSKQGFNSTWTKNFQMFKLDLEKAEEQEIKLPTSTGSSKKQESSRKTSTSASLTAKAFDCVDYNKLWKFFREMGIPDQLTCLLRKSVCG